MNNSTTSVRTTIKRVAFVAAFCVGALVSSAQTFVYDGVIYKASGTKLTAQKAGTAVTVGDAGPTAYTGVINIPSTISYGGKDYTVTSIGSVFKASTITKITIGDGVATISRGCFQDCTSLEEVTLPSDLATMNGDLFSGCTSLKEITIPGTVKEVASNQFKGCSGLKKITLADGATALEFSKAAFPDGTNGEVVAIEEAVLNRAIGTKYTTMDSKPFRASASLTKVTIGGSFKEIPASYFESSSALKTVVFENEPTSFSTNIFAGTGIEEITIPSSITSISASCFQGCKSLKKVTLGPVTSIADMAFYNSTVAEINFPAELTSIGQMAFSGAKLTGAVAFPAQLKSIGLQAFAKNKSITEVSIPASVTSIGDGAFMGCTGITKYTVDAASASYKNDADGSLLTNAAGDKLLAVAPASARTELNGAFTAVAPYAAYKAAGLKVVKLDACEDWGDYAFAGTGIEELNVHGTVGRYVAADCASLKSLSISGSEVPFGIASNCAALESVAFANKITTVKQDAFAGCTSLKSLDLGSILAIIEADAFKGAGIEEIKVGASVPASMAEGVFTAESNITAKVPVDLVDTYKAAEGWKYLTIAGDANIAAGPTDMGMPNGLYYAGTDGMIHAVYADGQDDTYDVGGVAHTFQLAQFSNRIYGASAGQKFVYSSTGTVDGDGQLFYISKIGGEVFQAVVLDNTGNNAYKDPFGLYIYNDTLYVNDRNVCIRKIPASAIALDAVNYPSWMENNWMGYYGAPWAYGCIKSGFAITQDKNAAGEAEPLYWVGMKYNGNGIFRFKESDINSGAKPAYDVYLNSLNPIFTTFYVDEKNQQMYIYIENAGANEATVVKGGVYRIDLAKLAENPDPSDFSKLEATLIDGSPVKYEGSATNEHVGISQFSPDENGEYLYWCYRAPSASEAETNEGQDYSTMKGGKYWWADKYDANNPLHQSGIKRVKLGEANPTVEMVVSGVEGYGCVPVNYEGSTKPAGVKDVIVSAAQNIISVVNNEIAVSEDATVVVYNMSGIAVASAKLGAGETMSVADLEAGAYIAVANGSAVAKFVK